jgi:hypothetical protein
MKKIVIGTVCLLLVTGGSVFAGSSSAISDQPQPQVSRGISYISGGFGVEERENLRQQAEVDNLEVSFALRNKQYLGGANVLIKDSNENNIFQAASDGPLLYVKLPKGTYRIEATAEGRTLTQVAHVPDKGRTRVYFAWPSERASDRTALD